MRRLLAVLLLGLGGCALAGRPPAGLPPLLDEGALYVYLAPFPHESRRLSFRVTGLAAQAEDGVTTPLTVRLQAVDAAAQLRDERLLAAGRLPPGRYRGLLLGAADGRLAGAERPADLLVAPEPALLEVPFEVRRGQAVVLSLTFDPERALEDGFRLTPGFRGEVPPRPSPALLGACSNTRSGDLTLFDTRSRAVAAVVATGQAPAGLALDPAGNRAWVALGAQDQLEVVDLLRAESVARIHLRAGDEPRSLLLLPDGRTLLVVNARSRTAAFVDSVTTQEVGRAPVGEDPWSALLLPAANRAVVVNRHGSSLTVLDLATRQAVLTAPTDPEPLQAATSRDGSRLYLIHRGSIHLAEYALPAVTPTRRIRVGLGAGAVRVDPRTDLVYVAMDDGRVQVFEAGSGLPVDAFDLPAGATRLVIDDPQDQLLALMPALRAVAVVDLTSRRLRAVIEVSDDPYDLRLATERR